jgi:cytoskeletal protein CcmA (bactofilin family)
MTSFFSGRRNKQESSDEDTPSLSGTVPSIPPAPPKEPAQQTLGFETVLGASSALEGKLKCSGNIRLDGSFNGSLEITGNVLVGETAKINADIDARNISIAGAVRGNVTGNRVQLLRSGRVWGDIKAAALTTEEGAFIDGKISMKTTETAPSFLDALPPEVDTDADETDDTPVQTSANESSASDVSIDDASTTEDIEVEEKKQDD